MLIATLENPSTTDTIGPGQEVVLPHPFSWLEIGPGVIRVLPVTAEVLAIRDDNTGFTPGMLLQSLVQSGDLLISFAVDGLANPTTDYAIETLGGGGGGSGLPPFAGVQYAALIENPASTPVFQRLTEDMILPAWSLSVGVSPSVVEIGVTVVNASLTCSYSRPAEAATIDDGGGPVALVSPFTAYTAPGPYLKTAINATQSFLLSANELGFPAKTNSTSIAWRPLVFWGVSVPPGGYTEAFIEGLASNALDNNRNRSIPYNAAPGEKLYYCYPTVYGAGIFKDAATGFAAGFTNKATVSVTNNYAVTNGYDVYESDQSGLGAVTIIVS